ncbi:F-box only protein 28-like [Asterias rubens]|uniref:F-box only protein 28-like n=1 Tax=Asterias rubens TaxID=7604 RepID=UPI001454EB74|nr:F-box only protein 28-like [Asterias rubens]
MDESDTDCLLGHVQHLIDSELTKMSAESMRKASSRCYGEGSQQSSSEREVEHAGKMNLVQLPDLILRQIFRCVSYSYISELRLVCRHFNRVCQDMLNHGSRQLERYHSKCFKHLKSQLPKRESERREHPLARRCEILSAVETRLSLLSMTYSKYIDLQLCCFIPGKVIDEAFTVLYHVQHTKTLQPMSELLRELRDISSMAIEHFDEEIVPTLKKKRSLQVPPCFSSDVLPTNTIFKQMMELKSGLKKRDSLIASVNRKVSTCLAHRKLISEQGQKILQQEQVIMELRNTITEQGHSITGQERRLALFEEKLNRYTMTFDLTQELTVGGCTGKRKSVMEDVNEEEDEGASKKARNI